MQFRQERTENDVVFNCCVWLNQNGWYAWRNSSTGVWDAQAKAFRKPAPFTLNGVSDIIAMRDGQVWFIECKFGHGDLSNDQRVFRSKCQDNDVEYLVVWGLEDLKKLIGPSTSG
jgi:Holliday junction resolvase